MSPSGYGTHMREMITAFRGEDCIVMPVIMGGTELASTNNESEASSRGKDTLKNLLSKNLWRTAKDFDLLRFDYLRAARRLEEAIKEFEPDLIYERCYYLQLSGVRMANKYGIKHAMEINSPYVDQNNFLSQSRSYIEGYARKIEKKQLQQTDLFLELPSLCRVSAAQGGVGGGL